MTFISIHNTSVDNARCAVKTWFSFLCTKRERLGLLVFSWILGAALYPLSAHAASFDCAKAREPADKFVCENPAISKLDDELGAAYRSALGKADPNKKKRLIEEQKHWLTHTRRVCTSEVCFKHAYWSRLAEVAMFFDTKSSLYKKEADKASDIQKVLTTSPLYKSIFSNPELCTQMMSDLKQMNGIHFVDPIVQTQSYEDPALDPWKRCNGETPLNYSALCLPDEGDWHDNKLLLEVCGAGYGLPPFKVFELPPINGKGQKRYIFYSDSTYGPMNEDWRKPTIGYGHQGFSQFAFPHCDEIINTAASFEGTIHDGPNYNSIIEYNNQYYFLMLYNWNKSYWLELRPIGTNEACVWGPVKPTSIQGVK